MNNIMLGKPMTVFGDGTQTRAFSYIDDVAPYIAQCINISAAKNEVINIGADEPYSINQLTDIIASVMGVKVNIINLPERKEVVNAYSDHTKAERIFNITKTTALHVGVKEMVQWSKKIGPMKTKKFNNIEVDKNMPSSWRKLTGSKR